MVGSIANSDFIKMIFESTTFSTPPRHSSTWSFFICRIFIIIFMSIWAMGFLLLKMSLFHNHVGEIISLSAYKQMGWIYAFTIVAAVANKHSLRDVTDPENIRRTVRHNDPAIHIKSSVFFMWSPSNLLVTPYLTTIFIGAHYAR